MVGAMASSNDSKDNGAGKQQSPAPRQTNNRNQENPQSSNTGSGNGGQSTKRSNMQFGSVGQNLATTANYFQDRQNRKERKVRLAREKEEKSVMAFTKEMKNISIHEDPL